MPTSAPIGSARQGCALKLGRRIAPERGRLNCLLPRAIRPHPLRGSCRAEVSPSYGGSNPSHRSSRLMRADQAAFKEINLFHRSAYAFIAAAFLSFLLSVYLWFSGQHDEGMFVGIWVPSILSFGTLISQAKVR